MHDIYQIAKSALAAPFNSPLTTTSFATTQISVLIIDFFAMVPSPPATDLK